MISLEKWKILTPLQKNSKNVWDLGKLIIAKGFKILPQSPINRPIWSHCCCCLVTINNNKLWLNSSASSSDIGVVWSWLDTNINALYWVSENWLRNNLKSKYNNDCWKENSFGWMEAHIAPNLQRTKRMKAETWDCENWSHTIFDEVTFLFLWKDSIFGLTYRLFVGLLLFWKSFFIVWQQQRGDSLKASSCAPSREQWNLRI